MSYVYIEEEFSRKSQIRGDCSIHRFLSYASFVNGKTCIDDDNHPQRDVLKKIAK